MAFPMAQQIELDSSNIADIGDPDDSLHGISEDLTYRRVGIVNVIFYGMANAADRGWVLIDAGLPGTANRIVEAAVARFGENSRPSAIVLTHGHFDHVGALQELSRRWEVPIYAHRAEFPYLDGSMSYPEPDPKAGGGIMTLLSPLFPREPVDVWQHLRELAADGSVPGMAGWKWISTPGHTEGHVSLWREEDRMLIAGDAFITTAQESAYAVLVQRPEMHGPPRYLTPNWESAAASVRTLAALEPDVVVTGHGPAMRGPEMLRALHQLADQFESVAVPEDVKQSPGRPVVD